MSRHSSEAVRFRSDIQCVDDSIECEGRWEFNNTVSRFAWVVNGETRWAGDAAEFRALAQSILAEVREACAQMAEHCLEMESPETIPASIRSLGQK